MVIDFKEYVAQKEAERAQIEAEMGLEAARQNLAEAYALKGLPELFLQHGILLDEDQAKIFIPFMNEAIQMGLSAAEIEALVIDCLTGEDEDD